VDASFSHATRETDLKAMASQTVDLLVIGGGMTGASIARDAARRGIRTALVDQGDFGRAASSRGSVIVHGGIPYLQARSWRSVSEETNERRFLSRVAPHLVRPLPVLLPFYTSDRWPAWKALAGLTLYDLLSLFRNVRAHRPLGKRAVLRREPELRPHGLQGGTVYWATQCTPTRLTVAMARDARAAGALVANYAEVVAFDKAGARITGAHVRDDITGETFTVRAYRFVAASGATTDGIRRIDDPEAGPLTRLMRESHVVVPTHRLGIRGAVQVTSPIDGRMIFVVPEAHVTSIGPAEVEVSASHDSLRPSAQEVLYLLRTTNALFPAARLTTHDVISTGWGIRVERRTTPHETASSLSGGQLVEERQSGLLVVAGSNLGRARALAEHVTDRVARALTSMDGRPPPRACTTTTAAVPGGEVADLDVFTRELSDAGAPLDLAAHLVANYGTEAPAVLHLIERDRSLGTWVVPGLPVVWGEVVHAVRREMAMTLSDVLVRRTALLRHDPQHVLQQAPDVARRLGNELGWGDERRQSEVSRYVAHVRDSLAFATEFDDMRSP